MGVFMGESSIHGGFLYWEYHLWTQYIVWTSFDIVVKNIYHYNKWGIKLMSLYELRFRVKSCENGWLKWRVTRHYKTGSYSTPHQDHCGLGIKSKLRAHTIDARVIWTVGWASIFFSSLTRQMMVDAQKVSYVNLRCMYIYIYIYALLVGLA